jgi:hypothetical protein
MASQNTGNRRGSYIYAASAAEEGDVSGPYGRPAYLYGRPDENLLVDFPETSQSGNRVVNNHDMNNNNNNMNHNNSQGHNPNIDMQMQQMQMHQMQMQQMQMQQMQMQNGGPNMNGDGSQLQYHPQQYAGNVPYDASQYAYAAQAQQYAQYSTDQAGGGNASGNGSSGWNKPAGRRSEAARMEELADSQDLPGGPNHRPLVGGFAAAAYEAAKAHHYSMKTKSDGNSGGRPKDGPPPPSI